MSLTVLDVTPAVTCCPPFAARALPADAATQLAPLFKALGDPVRLRLLSLIASVPEACVCDLTDAFDVTGATISHHLRVLREAGLVDCERRGTWVYYRIRAEVLGRLGGLLQTVPQDEARPVVARPVDGAASLEDGAAAPEHGPAARHEHGAAAPPEDQGALISGNPDVLRVLADPLRARIVERLADGPASTTDLVTETGARQPNVSGHLRLLRDAGLVVTEARGRFTYYRLAPEALQTTADRLAGLAARARTGAADR